jgi:hypothetical protein
LPIDYLKQPIHLYNNIFNEDFDSKKEYDGFVITISKPLPMFGITITLGKYMSKRKTSITYKLYGGSHQKNE